MNKMGARHSQDYYSILNINRDASIAEIKKAYKRLAMLHHPDRAGADGAERFILLKEAHDTLTDSRRKAAYDMALAAAGGAPVNHNLSFVISYIKKNRPGADSAPAGALGATCPMCRGAGRRRDMFGARRVCKWCGGLGTRRI